MCTENLLRKACSLRALLELIVFGLKVFVTDETGKIVDRYERNDDPVHNLDGPPSLPALVQRDTVYEEEGTRLRISCPKYSTHDFCHKTVRLSHTCR